MVEENTTKSNKVVNRRIEIPTTKEKFLRSYLHAINGFFSLAPKELECLEKMLMINTKYTATKEIRLQLVEQLGRKSVKDVNNLIKYLKDKKAIFPDKENRRYTYNPIVVPNSREITFAFKVK